MATDVPVVRRGGPAGQVTHGSAGESAKRRVECPEKPDLGVHGSAEPSFTGYYFHQYLSYARNRSWYRRRVPTAR